MAKMPVEPTLHLTDYLVFQLFRPFLTNITPFHPYKVKRYNLSTKKLWKINKIGYHGLKRCKEGNKNALPGLDSGKASREGKNGRNERIT